MSRRNLPPLQAQTPYVAADFERFEYFGSVLTGESTATLRLHLKNATTLDIPASDEQLQHLLVLLCEAFPVKATTYVLERWPA